MGCEVQKCEFWSVKFGVGRKQLEVRSVDCEVWIVQCEVSRVILEAVRSETCEVGSVKCGV